MIYQVCSIFDMAAGCYMPPVFVPHLSAALRGVIAAASEPGSPLAVHASEFALHRLGTFDDQTGVFAADQQVIGVVSGLLAGAARFPVPAAVPEAAEKEVV